MEEIMQSVKSQSVPHHNSLLSGTIHYNLSPETLIAQTMINQQGTLSDTGALVVNTGAFTGRSPKDKFIVKDELTRDTVSWNEFNIPIEEKYFDLLYRKMLAYISDKSVWVRDCIACADTGYSFPFTVINETPWANLFCYNMFLRPEKGSKPAEEHWTIIHAPGFSADPETDGTRQKNFSVVNFSKKTLLIGGSAYTGEIKKGVFTILNFLLPLQQEVMTMHCSANTGRR